MLWSGRDGSNCRNEQAGAEWCQGQAQFGKNVEGELICNVPYYYQRVEGELMLNSFIPKMCPTGEDLRLLPNKVC